MSQSTFYRSPAPMKKPGMPICTCNPGNGGRQDGGRKVFGTNWLPTWLKNISRFCEKAYLRGIRQRVIGQDN